MDLAILLARWIKSNLILDSWIDCWIATRSSPQASYHPSSTSPVAAELKENTTAIVLPSRGAAGQPRSLELWVRPGSRELRRPNHRFPCKRALFSQTLKLNQHILQGILATRPKNLQRHIHTSLFGAASASNCVRTSFTLLYQAFLLPH